MAEHHLLGPYIRRFLLEHVVADRNLSRNTQRNYRDAIRVLLRFITARHRIDPADLTVEQVTADVVREFLQYLEQERQNTAATLNQRVTVIHSLFRFIGRHIPELVERASQLQAVPLRRVDHPTVPYLEKAEIDAILATPDRRRRLGQRDYALLLFLYNTGARADETAHLTRGALDLGRPASVRILGKGRKMRLCPLWDHTAQILRELLGGRLDGPTETPVFSQCARSVLDAVRHSRHRRTHGRPGCHTDALAQHEASQPPFGEAHDRRTSAPRRRRHQHHPRVARSRLARNHQPLCGSRP
jgi:integrase/recombinase XerD